MDRCAARAFRCSGCLPSRRREDTVRLRATETVGDRVWSIAAAVALLEHPRTVEVARACGAVRWPRISELSGHTPSCTAQLQAPKRSQMTGSTPRCLLFRPSAPRDVEHDVDVPARRVRVRAALVRLGHQRLRVRPARAPGTLTSKPHAEPEAPAADRADVDVRGHRRAVHDASRRRRGARSCAARWRSRRRSRRRTAARGWCPRRPAPPIASGIDRSRSSLPSSVRVWPLRPLSVAVATAV